MEPANVVVDDVRNFCVIAHVDHGKSTLTECLARRSGLSHKERPLDQVRRLSLGATLSGAVQRLRVTSCAVIPFHTRKDSRTRRTTNTPPPPTHPPTPMCVLSTLGLFDVASASRFHRLQVRPDQVDRIITIKSTGAVMEIDGLTLNLIDSPGHRDFSSEVTAALRLTDGALVVVDCASGVKVQTRTVLRQALQEGVRPVLVLNKMDRLVLELNYTEEDVYARCLSIVNEINDLIATYTVAPNQPVVLSPVTGSVVFASGKARWGFTLPQLAAKYAAPDAGVSKEQVLNTLWGDVFYSSTNRRWSRKFLSDDTVRGFAARVARPLIASLRGLDDANEQVAALAMLGGQRGALDKQLPLADALVTAIREHLPSPKVAQLYRAAMLYTGPQEGAVYEGIKNCDPNGPLVVFVAKMTPDVNFFWAFGRVLSGTVRRNQKVLVLGPNFDPALVSSALGTSAASRSSAAAGANDMHQAVVQGVASPLGVSWKVRDSCPAGCIVALQGIDKVCSKSATLVDDLSRVSRGAAVDAPPPPLFPIKQMRFTVAPIVAYSVRPKNGADLPAFNQGLHKLAKMDSLVQIRFDEATKETLVVGSGELHMEVLLGDLKELAKGIELVVGEPSVSLRETVVATTRDVALAKSSNKHNRVFVTAGPLSEATLLSMEESAGTSRRPNADKKLWCSGFTAQEQAECGLNQLVDETKAVDYLSESKGPFVDAFKASYTCAQTPVVVCKAHIHTHRHTHTHVRPHTFPPQRHCPAQI
jgi:elongation factor 2